uniref:uncharacterized protein LOC120822864 n=1 Tax=Gasterosteus aculeatus aculeatus TaxID=481459 RepID=UPI001A99DFAB|nr:uncharacterized protein LOC120822864 [Gasterosteus aculeatus aculeatus]
MHEFWLTYICSAESPSENKGHSFHNINVEEQQEDHWLEENPIYGNINSDRRDSVEACHEIMTMQHAGDHAKRSSQADLNYASLDLKMAKKRGKKNRHQQSPTQRRSKLQDEPPAQLTPPASAFLEVEADVDAHLPPRDTMLSHSSIYLNSQQIAQETEDRERDCEAIRKREDGRSAQRNGEQGGSRIVCTQRTELEAFQSGRSFHK